MKIRALLIATVLMFGGCATVRGALKTLDEAADIACNVFAKENPDEFKRLALSVLPPAAASSAEKNGFDPRILCTVKEIIDVFRADQQRMQRSMAVSLQSVE